MAQKLSLVAVAVVSGLVGGVAATQLGFAVAGGANSNAAWTLGDGDLASAVCPEGTVMVGLHKTTPDGIVSMDPAAYRETVPVCASR